MQKTGNNRTKVMWERGSDLITSYQVNEFVIQQGPVVTSGACAVRRSCLKR
uniref:Uncharacterized protein n=1 Tax=Arundo donax TaxID=35708 RepID=A0A0A9GUE9_ARUDO